MHQQNNKIKQLAHDFRQPMTTLRISNIHITDLFFHAEINQAVGSDASEAWLLEQRSVCPRKPLHSAKLARPHDRSTPQHRSETSSDRRPEGPSMASRQIKASPQEEPGQLESAIASIQLLLGEESRLDIGLLYTDAAHTVLNRISRLNSIL
jgi:hypothetical protein